MASSTSARTPAGKRVVNQEELRRLMKEKQRLSTNRKRIESPFAKYNRLGQLSCALCNTPVKSELLWQTHVLGKQHRERVAELKGAKGATQGPSAGTAPQPTKRKTTDVESQDAKKAKASVDQVQPSTSASSANFEKSGKEATRVASSKTGLGLLPDYEEEEEEEEEEELGGGEERRDSSKHLPDAQGREHSLASPRETTSNVLPNDPFNTNPPKAPLVPHSGSIEKAEIHEKVVERRENTAEALPEGFFDDPEVDAKVRKVDAPKDQMDKEWDEFQKAMRQVNTISEAIVAEEDEEGRLDRQIGEIDEQIECYRRVEKLRNRQDEIKNKLKEVLTIKELQKKEEENVDSDDEGELQDLLSQDWRVKGALL
ncbi:rCG32593 [Rattus norvegicus]|uniref:Zinc finger protein 830 n=2 Tax=Rattus norvegicus TaxID=10116 RepID=ZN830_RAT|nr:zinc finger protein 830 [Rattus norvegicus]Q3MHS2.1 RecName: Full=Zinc finger protein 830; AltName: Full=Coiled-coil domain-containing protein 16 [Rattus norvegicus]AAI04718.1 Zinc finger protein 830 [Rattus norvegicus]EDM05444.1 rCG32593 [Rattus norvegicus]|eukprot:NP_001032437.1 zinc finger protein 830 [Rattus norvegicus]